MAEDMEALLKQLKSAKTQFEGIAKAVKSLVPLAKTLQVGGGMGMGQGSNGGMGLPTGTFGAGGAMGPGASMRATSFTGGFGTPRIGEGRLASPSMAEREIKFGKAHDPNRPGARTMGGPIEIDTQGRESIGFTPGNMNGRRTQKIMNNAGFGGMVTGSDNFTQADYYSNLQAQEAARDNAFGKSRVGKSMMKSMSGLGMASSAKDAREYFGSLPSFNQNLIMSAMPTIQDSMQLLSGVQNAVSSFQPDIASTMQRTTNYYGATLGQGGKLSRKQVSNATLGTLASIGGLTGAGSDAEVAAILSGSGMTVSSDANSTYQQTLRTVGHAARYLNIDNATAAKSVQGLTSGTGAANMLRNFGIYTADLKTGKEKTQGQIFEELAQRLTAGRRSATVEQTQASIRRGALGATINSFFQGDEAGASMFKQYMIDRAGGRSMDLSNEGAMQSLYGKDFNNNRNPLNAQMSLNTADAQAQNEASDAYMKGIEGATAALQGLTLAAGKFASIMGVSNAAQSAIMGNKQVQALTSGAQSIIGYTSKGQAAIQEAILQGEYGLPTEIAASTATIGAITAGVATGMIPTAAYLGASAAGSIFGNAMGGSPSGPGGGGSSEQTGSSGLSGNSSSTQKVTSWNPPTNAKGEWHYGFVTNSAGNQQFHDGVDSWAAEGTPVKAVAAGKVVTAQYSSSTKQAKGSGSYGNYVVIYHEGGYKTVYAHLSAVLVAVGDLVTAGQVIGKVGQTGDAQGPHLHLEVFKSTGEDSSISGQANVDPSTVNTAQLEGAGITSAAYNPAGGSSGAVSASEASVTDQVNAAFAKGTALPGNVASLVGSMQGLMSGDINTMTASLRGLTAGMGVSLSALNSSATPYASALGAGVGASTAASLVGTNQASSGSRVVNINLSLPNASQSEAEKFAQLVKQYLEADTLQTNTVRT